MQLWERWSFMDAFYFCFVTVTTIGFGDIVPQNADLLPATLAYVVFGLIITTMCIGYFFISIQIYHTVCQQFKLVYFRLY